MAKYPCSQNAPKEAFKEPIPAAYSVMGSDPLPITNGEIRWTLGNFSPDMEPYHQIGILNNAFQNWRNVLPLWDFRGTMYLNKAQWRIYFVKDDGKIYASDGKYMFDSPFDFSVSDETIAIQYVWTPGYKHALTMFLDDRKFFHHTKGNGKCNMEFVCTHEIGHGLRLNHSDDDTDYNGKVEIMGAYYAENAFIGPDSVQGIVDLHYKQMISEATDHPLMKFLFKEGEPRRSANGLKENKGCNITKWLMKG